MKREIFGDQCEFRHERSMEGRFSWVIVVSSEDVARAKVDFNLFIIGTGTCAGVKSRNLGIADRGGQNAWGDRC